MNTRLRVLKEQLKHKERELLSLQNKTQRMKSEYNMVRYNPHLEWFGKERKNKAQARERHAEHQIAILKQQIHMLEQQEEKETL